MPLVNHFLLKSLKLFWRTVKQREIDDIRTGEAARSLRQKARLTLKEIGSRIGVTGAFISHLEYGRGHWKPDFVQKYNRALKEKQKRIRTAA